MVKLIVVNLRVASNEIINKEISLSANSLKNTIQNAIIRQFPELKQSLKAYKLFILHRLADNIT